MTFNAQAFDRKQFENMFARSLGKLIESEKITKETLRELSRTVLEAHHMTEDVAFINRLIDALTPVNRKVAVAYFQRFSGFNYSHDEGKFTRKNKRAYADKLAESEKFLDDPLNNMWSWADRHIEVQPKGFKPEAITKYVQNAIKQAAEAGLAQVDVMRAIVKGGMSAESIIAIMDELGYDVETEDKPEVKPVGEALI